VLRRLSLSIVFAASLVAAPARCDAPPDAAEEPVFADLSGRTVRVSDHRGDVVLLHFWATWCGACKPEMPVFVRLHDSLGPKGLRVLGASANARDEAELVRRYMSDAGMRFESWLWVSAKDMKHYGVGPGLPATVVIDRAGRVRRAIRGRADEATLRPLLEQLLAEPKPVSAAGDAARR